MIVLEDRKNRVKGLAKILCKTLQGRLTGWNKIDKGYISIILIPI